MQFRFEDPEWLWALIAVAFLGGLMLWKRKLPGSFSWRRFFVTLLAFSLSVFALARPQAGQNFTQTIAARSNLFVAVDISRSMLARDISPSRLAFAVSFAERLLQQLSGVKVALYPFALDGYIQIPLTTDTAAIEDALESLNPNMTTNQGTDLSSALETLLGHIVRMEQAAKKAGIDWFPTQVLLLSDGESHVPLRDEVTRRYRSLHIPIFTVAAGTVGGAMISPELRFDREEGFRPQGSRSVRTLLHPETLQAISAQTGGDYIAPRFEEVQGLAKRLQQSMSLGKLASSFKVDREFFPFLFALALLLFGFEFGLGRWEFAIRSLLFVFLLGAFSARGADLPKVDTNADEETQSAQNYDLGLEYLKRGNFQKAAEAFQESALRTQDPTLKKKSLFNLGNTFLRQFDPNQAIDSYQQAMDVKTKNRDFEKTSNLKISENLALAAKVLERMKQQPSEGEGKGQSQEGEGKQKKESPDPKGPQKKFTAEEFNESQKQKIFDLISSEEQQTMQRLQELRNRNRTSRITDKPW
jgi:Ca-activated chloride channel homolog